MTLQTILARIQRKPQPNGFAGMSELVIAAGVGTLLVMASGVALQTTGSLIKQTEEKRHFVRIDQWTQIDAIRS